MYLKKIEVQGFKSFANKIIFDFNKGINGIVGPNGSGKSNVSDAIRWVLGEQSSKNLRGSNMQDVIFAGTALRKAQGYAYVSITFDNSDRFLDIDFEEVNISRRLFRSGESEYMLNGSIVRLKDINELFYDTGIGKDGYSIIGQGQVEKILSTKGEERRELFDEAVGITKFKRRKNLAIKKLENEKTNLSRAEDILNELEKQLKPLKLQATKAKEFLSLRDDLKVLDANMFILKEKSIQKELIEANENENILKNDLALVNKESQAITLDFENIDKEIICLDKAIEEYRQKLSTSNVELKDLYGQINVLKEQINTQIVSLEHKNNRKISIKNEIENKEKENISEKQLKGEILSDFKKQENENSALIDEINALNLKIIKIEKDLSSYNDLKLKQLDISSNLFAKMESIKSKISEQNIRRSELNARYLSINSENEILNKKIEDKDKDLKELIKEKEKFSRDILNLEKVSEEAKNKLKQLNYSLNNSNNLYQKYKANFESLKNISERYEGFGISIKKIMEKKKDISGIKGLVADILKIDKKYELAIEIALGAKIQNIVVEDEYIAKKLIEYLKENKLGRATFLPLSNTASGIEIKNKNILNEKGVIALASDLVEAELEYKALVFNLLSRVIIVDNIDNAINISKKYKYEYRLVTLSGEQFLPGGSLSGGAYKNSSNLLSRKRELKELETKLDQEEKNIENYTIKIKELDSTIKGDILKYSENTSKLNNISNEINIINNNINIFIERKEQIAVDIENLRLEIKNLDLQINENNLNYTNLEKEIDIVKNKHTINKEDEKILEENLKKLKLEIDIKKEKQRQSDIDIGLLKSKLEHIDIDILRIAKEIEGLEKEKISLDFEDSYEKLIEEKNNHIKASNKRIDALNVELINYEKKIEELNSQKELKAKKHKLIFAKKDDIMQRSSLLDKDIFRLQARKEKLEEKLADISNYIWNEYELDLKQCLLLRREEFSLASELKKKIDDKKKSIKNLGNINISAIEEYKNISMRYEELKLQYDDIIAASAKLQDIIVDLEKGMKKQFKENFHLINQEFNRVFNELFAGGNARLELEEGSEMLEGDIIIISQPPGKKLQNMLQLSGGEKALTAISLLFAIQNLRPSPFVILDEIEAALDDSNVDRFAQYLHKLNKKTQFIVITHRRGTMVNVDSLYGITMQEKGISTLVSVNLIEDKLEN